MGRKITPIIIKQTKLEQVGSGKPVSQSLFLCLNTMTLAEFTTDIGTEILCQNKLKNYTTFEVGEILTLISVSISQGKSPVF